MKLRKSKQLRMKQENKSTIDKEYELSWLFRTGLALEMNRDNKILRSEVREAFVNILELYTGIKWGTTYCRMRCLCSITPVQ